MPNMKLILERWDSYLIFEEDTISKLKTDPTSVEELADDVTSIKDRKRLQAVLNALVADPQVIQAVNALKDLSAVPAPEPPPDVEEGISDDLLNLSTQAYIGIDKLMNSPEAQKVMKIAPPLLGLALIAFKLMTDGTLYADDVDTLATILKTTGKTDMNSVMNMVGASAEGAVTEKKWNY